VSSREPVKRRFKISSRQPSSLAATWPQAMSLAERISAVDPSVIARLSSVAGVRRRTVAAARMRMWREAATDPNADVSFDRRLRLLNLYDELQAEQLLSIEPSQFAQETPDWIADIFAAYDDYGTVYDSVPIGKGSGHAIEHAASAKAYDWQAQLASIVEPIFARKIAQYSVDVRHQAAVAGRGADLDVILRSRPTEMHDYVIGAFVLDMHVKKLGKSGVTEFSKYLDEFTIPQSFLRTLARYPVLARVMCDAADRWARAEVLLARRYLSDVADIASFCRVPPESFRLSSVASCLGDKHRGLQTVHLLEATDGVRLIYKPTDCRVFGLLGRFLDWLRSLDADLAWVVPGVLAREEGYGWVRYVERRPCLSETDVAAFYRRMGSLIAVSWMLGSYDLHGENVIASGAYPVVVDAETVLGFEMADIRKWEGVDPADRLGVRMLRESVLRGELLPSLRPMGHGMGDGLVDRSAVGARPSQNVRLDGWAEAGTVGMRKGPIDVDVDPPGCAPYLKGRAPANAEDFAAEIEDGFRRTSELLLSERRFLLSGRSPLASLASCHQRVLFRPTHAYARFMRDLHHPDLLMDGLDRDIYLDQLLFRDVGFRCAEEICQAERQAVERGDIPYFLSSAGSRDLLADDGSLLVRDYFGTTTADALRSRLELLTDGEIDRQAWYVRSSLQSLAVNRSGYPVAAPCCQAPPLKAASSEFMLNVVREIAEHVAALRFDGGTDGVTWPTVRSFNGENWHIASAGHNLYDGAMGIALFLAVAGQVLQDAGISKLARRTADTVISEVRASGRDRRVGAYDGAAGLLYGLSCLSVTWNTDYSELQRSLLREIRDRAPEDPFLDVIGGAAGAGIVIANTLGHLCDRELALEAASACAERIRASTSGHAPGWFEGLAVAGGSPTGLAHGSAGVALACLRLGALLRDKSIRVLANPAEPVADAEGTAPRTDIAPAGSATVSWCNGAVGVGLARCLALLWEPDGLQDPRQSREDVVAALRSARSGGLGNDHSLCHGDLGTMELHFAGGLLDGMSAEADYGQKIASMVAQHVVSHGPVCGSQPGMVVPGLMNGLAGIGFGLIRSVNASIPNVLCLTI
jgi:type 2 lantibiotic biosynthesis protein LanM